MENINKQFEQLYILLELTEFQSDLIKKLHSDVQLALRQPPVISSVCTCSNAEREKDSLVPVYCHNCNAYVQTDL